MSPETLYPWTRTALAILCIPVARHVRSWYFLASAVSLLIPVPSTPGQWRYVWAPFEAVRLALAIHLTVSLLSTSGRILAPERRLIIGFGTCAGLMLTAAGWVWKPENWFQGFVTIREYVYVILASIVASMWVRLWIRPVCLPMLFGCWAWWLLFATLMAIGGRGGILWEAVAPDTSTWALIGCIGMIGQCLVACMLLVSLHPCQPDA